MVAHFKCHSRNYLESATFGVNSAEASSWSFLLEICMFLSFILACLHYYHLYLSQTINRMISTPGTGGFILLLPKMVVMASAELHRVSYAGALPGPLESFCFSVTGFIEQLIW